MDSVTNFFWNEEELNGHARGPHQNKGNEDTTTTYDFSKSKVVFPKKDDVEGKSGNADAAAVL